jgi:hypothetical protein
MQLRLHVAFFQSPDAQKYNQEYVELQKTNEEMMANWEEIAEALEE